MQYESVTLKKPVTIDKVYTVHYFEYMSDFTFSGESHDFWEFLCVDKGAVNVMADGRQYHLEKDDIIFHKPNEFHALSAIDKIAPNLVVISFECLSPCMEIFSNRITTIQEHERNLLAHIILEAQNAFSSPLNDYKLSHLTRRDDPLFGCEQMLKLNLEMFLIGLIRRLAHPTLGIVEESKSLKKKNDTEIYQRVIAYLEQNIHNKLSIDQIAHDNLVGRSQLQKLFRQKHGCGIIEYFCQLKIDAAKRLIRANHMNFTQISDYLGYTSIHYFSRQFKQFTGMTPSEYSSSIKVLSEKLVVNHNSESD